MIHVKIQMELLDGDEFTVELTPRLIGHGQSDAQLAAAELDRAVKDAKAWLAARGYNAKD